MDWMKMKTLSAFLCTVLFLLFPIPTFAAIPEPEELSAQSAVSPLNLRWWMRRYRFPCRMRDKNSGGAGMKFNIFFLYCYSFQWQ